MADTYSTYTYTEISQPNTVTDDSSGNDTISSWDVINGVAGNDRILGNADDDTIFAGTGDDTIFGNEGNDALIGEQGNDILSGGSGNDLLQGGLGGDTLTGGSDADTFDLINAEAKTRTERIYQNFPTPFGTIKIPIGSRSVTYFDDVDVIQDFNAAEGDKIRIYEFDMSGNAGDFSTGVHNGDTHLMFKGATFAVLEGVTNFNLNNDLDINPG